MVVSRGTSNKNSRGGSRARARRRQYLVDTFGDGTKVDCVHCGTTLDVNTVSSDRVIPGALGGTYKRENLAPSCLPCNSREGAKLGIAIKRSKKLKKGDQFQWNGILMTVTAVAKDKTWANFQSGTRGGAKGWRTRLSLPLSSDYVPVKP